MKRLLGFVMLGLFGVSQAGYCQAASQTCAGSNTSNVALNPVTVSNLTEHASGLHSFALKPVFGCIYSHGNSTTCNTECTVTPNGATLVDPLGPTITIETGSLNTSGSHQVSGGWNNGDGFGTAAGASCSGTLAGAATNCLFVPFTQTCFVSVTVTAGGTSVSTNGTKVWDSGPDAVANTCPAVADPQATPAPTPAPTPPQVCNVPTKNHLNNTGDPGDPVGDGGTCATSPVLIDTDGSGFQLTAADSGVLFDIRGDGAPIQIAWTAQGSRNAFLALPGPDGLVTNGKQLFGNFTAQPNSPTPNGFAALSVYDQADHGGNGDGVIDQRDQIYSSLRLWIDENHDGIAQANELHSLSDLGVVSISLTYGESGRTDQFGNQFRFKAKVNPQSQVASDVGKTAYDVFLVVK